jgi:isoprenylcysteine carboxyl methyltransferase (ICMT) family protein YpbQ
MTIDFWPTIAFVLVMLSWLGFGLVFFFGRQPAAGASDRKRDSLSIVGIVLQGVSYGIVWGVRRSMFTSIVSVGNAAKIGLSILAIALAAASVWFSGAAFRTLGKQWSLAARVLEGHKLVTQGPYNVVRNPIYTGMFGMLLATGLAVSHWIGLVIAIIVFAIGTVIRVRSEEKLLRETFGAEFDDYARRVPAVVPFLI